jgi:hypothetical protein
MALDSWIARRFLESRVSPRGRSGIGKSGVVVERRRAFGTFEHWGMMPHLRAIENKSNLLPDANQVA